jgi:hypothetical protein
MSAPITERRRRGDLHPSGDGRVFFGYRSASEGGGEYWASPERLEEERRRAREQKARSRVENPEKTREINLAWSRRNPEKLKEKNAKWRAENPERAKAGGAKWYKKNTERVKANVARWKASNPEKKRELNSAWEKRNPEKVRVRRAQRRARERGATHPHHSTEIEIVLLQSAARLRECLRGGFHLDHIVPLDRGGSHHHANLRILPARLNFSKNNKLDSELPSHLLGAIKQWSPFLN